MEKHETYDPGASEGSGRPACQECGGEVHMEVSWEHWGVDRLYFECQGCGRSGWTEPKPSVRTDGGVNSADNPQDSSECNVHATDFWCPFCEAQITHECGYDHAHAHMDRFEYAADGDRFYRQRKPADSP